MNRRSILKLFGAAPVGLPVVARDAAAKAGISSVGSYGAMMAGGFAPEPGCGPSNQDWAMKYAKRVFGANWLSEKKEEWRNRHATILDPDLASSRSLSLSAAYRMQKDRDFARFVDSERRGAKRQFLEAFGFDFVS